MRDGENLRTLHSNIVRVSLPPEALYNFDQFQKVQKGILGRLGCLGCCSGFDIRWDNFREFQVDEKLNITAGSQF